jgi:hypothetical protein
MSIRDRGIDGAPEPEARVESAPKPEPENVPQGPPESRPAPTSPESRSGLSIPSSGVGTAVVEHKLVGESDRFPGGTVVCFWTRVVGAKSDETIRHVWKREGRTVMVRRLNIRSAHWRTYSRYALPENDSATWVVEAQTADGSVLLAREEFLSFAPVPATPESTEDRPPHGIDESVHEGGRE